MSGTVAMYFTNAQAARASGIPERRLVRWVDMGIVVPALGSFFDFRNLVELRTLEMLFKKQRVPVHGRKGLREIGEWLRTKHDRPWSRLRLHVAGREIVFQDGAEKLSATSRGQVVKETLAIDLRPLETQARTEAARVSGRARGDIGVVVRQRGIQSGAPCLKGTRIPTRVVWHMHRAGESTEDILRSYPSLKAKDVQSAVSFEKKQQRASAA